MAEKDKRPNIIILVPDEMRADTLGNPLIPTPNLDRLCQDSAVFKNNFTVNPVCSPSRCCTFTGQYPQNGGHRSLFQLLRPHEENLFKFLKDSGYEVAWIGRNDLFTREAVKASITTAITSQDLFFRQLVKDARELLRAKSFSGKLQAVGKGIREIAKIILKKEATFSQSPLFGKIIFKRTKFNPFAPDDPWFRSFYFGERSQDQKIDTDHQITAAALDYLDGKPAEPFCLYLAYSFPHPPYCVEQPYFSMIDRDRVPAPIPPLTGGHPQFMALMRERYQLDQLTEEDFREIRATYYGMIAKLDQQIGQVMDKLKEIREYDSSVICLFSDHGDYAGDYGLTEKWVTGYQDCLTKVPLVIKQPQGEMTGSQFEQLTQTIDIFPTLLQYARIDTEYTHFGKNLIPLMAGENEEHRQAVFTVGGYNLHEPQCFEPPLPNPNDPILGVYFHKTNIQKDSPQAVSRATMIRTQEMKLVIRSEEDGELYDLAADPIEVENLYHAPAYQKQRAALESTLLKWYLDTSDNPHWVKERQS